MRKRIIMTTLLLLTTTTFALSVPTIFAARAGLMVDLIIGYGVLGENKNGR